MTPPRSMRDFGLEVFFSEWEFKAKHHMTASDMESLSVDDLLALASPEDAEAFRSLWLGYTQTWGLPLLRQEIASTYEQMAESNILCLAGAGEGLYMVAKILLDKDDHAIVPTPNYQSAETMPLSLCEVTGLPLTKGSMKGGWGLDLDALKAAIRPNTKLLSLNFPHNPTGQIIPLADLEAIIEICRAHDIWILSDEVYRGVELDPADRLPQICDLYEKGISLNVMSKAYGLPGLRIGWIAAQDKALLEKVERYKHYLSICNSAPSEQLALIALKARDRILARNRGLVERNITALEQLFSDYPGIIDWSRPVGGCVAFAHFTGPGGVEAFCRRLLDEQGVLLLPSSIYVSDLGDTPQDHFRIGFGRDQVFTDGLAAMRRFFEHHYADFRA